MNSRKSVGPRMGLWRTPALAGYSCKDLPSRTTQRCLLLRKDEITPRTVAPELLKALAILLDTTFKRFSVD